MGKCPMIYDEKMVGKGNLLQRGLREMFGRPVVNYLRHFYNMLRYDAGNN